jgi:hypothetical protein
LLSDANLEDPLDEEVAELFKSDPEAAIEKGNYSSKTTIFTHTDYLARQWTLDFANA